MVLSLILPIILAATIQTGDSYAKSTVINQVEGGNVYTKIEVEANGQKKVLESNEPGEHKLEISSPGSSATAASQTSVDQTASPSGSENSTTSSSEKKDFWQRLIDFFTNLFGRFL